MRDRVTGFEGVVCSISFDLYGCIQATLNPGMDKDGKLKDSMWFDIGRLERKVLASGPMDRVMEKPDYLQGSQAEGKQGPAEKPTPQDGCCHARC
jgi:hypothetical protein